VSKEHDEDAEFYHDLYGDVIAYVEEELYGKADDAYNGRGTMPKLAVGNWSLSKMAWE